MHKRLLKRFEAKFIPEPNSGCWLWLGAYDRENGYGNAWYPISHSYIKAHRLAWLLYVGDIPNGLQICHKCDNPSCVNPAHLFTGTQIDNELDKISKNRQRKGISCPNAKLTDDDIRYIRSSIQTRYELADLFNITPSNISYIRSNKTWKHVQ